MNLEKRVSRLEVGVPPSLTAEEYLALSCSGRASDALLDACTRRLSDEEPGRAIVAVAAKIGEAEFRRAMSDVEQRRRGAEDGSGT